MTRDQEACGLIQTQAHGARLDPLQLVLVPQRREPHDDREPARHRARRRGDRARSRPATSSSTSAATTARCSTATRPRGCATSASTRPTSSRYAVAKGYDVVNDFFSIERAARAPARPEGQGRHEHRDVLRPRAPAHVRRRRRAVLAESGIWVIELHYLPMMLEANAFDAIVHEHLEYYSLAVIERLIGEEGLEVVSAELNDINGGSIRLFIGHQGAPRAHARAAGSAHGAARQGVRAGARLARALRDVPARRRAGSRRPRHDVPRDPRRRQDDPRLRRLDEGQHDPPVRGHRSQLHRGRRRPQPRQVGLGDDRDEDPDHQRGGVARDEPRLLPRAAVALPRRVPRARARSSSRAAASSSCRCRTCASSAAEAPTRRRAGSVAAPAHRGLRSAGNAEVARRHGGSDLAPMPLIRRTIRQDRASRDHRPRSPSSHAALVCAATVEKGALHGREPAAWCCWWSGPDVEL